MNQKQAFAGIFLFCISCSSAPFSQKKLDFSDIESLNFGESTSSELVSKFGRPSQIVPIKKSPGQDVWIYSEPNRGVLEDRVNLYVDTKTDRLVSAAWIPNETDEFKSKDAVISHFGGIGFKSKEEGWIANHYYSNDVTISNPQKGVALFVDVAHQEVQYITISKPSEDKLLSGGN